MTALTALVCTPGFEEILLAQLGLKSAHAPRAIWPGWVELASQSLHHVAREPAFARQLLAEVQLVRAQTIQTLADAAIESLRPQLEAGAEPLRLTCDALALDPSLRSRARYIEAAFRERLKSRHRKLWRRLAAVAGAQDKPPSTVVSSASGHISLVLLDAGHLAVSYAKACVAGVDSGSSADSRDAPTGCSHWWSRPLSVWPLGRVELPFDKVPPSRAYLKLREAWEWMGARPREGETVVDLGGSPGGWAYVCLQEGARVTGVDRAPYADVVRIDPRFREEIGDAFTFRPTDRVDWLVCDVICAPERTVALVMRWLDDGLCDHVVATLKFKSDSGYEAIETLENWLGARGGATHRIKHLGHNRHEVTVMVHKNA